MTINRLSHDLPRLRQASLIMRRAGSLAEPACVAHYVHSYLTGVRHHAQSELVVRLYDCKLMVRGKTCTEWPDYNFRSAFWQLVSKYLRKRGHVCDGLVYNVFTTHNAHLTLDIYNDHAPSDDDYKPEFNHLTSEVHNDLSPLLYN